MFKTAKSLNTAAETKGKKKDRKQVALAGVEKLAHLDAIIKAATSAKAVIESTISDEVRHLFEEEIESKDGMKPESFDATEGLALVNCQLRKRGANSALNEEERKLLEEHGVKFKKEILAPQLFVINPAYATNEKMLNEVEKSLAKLGLPEDFFAVQEEVSKFIVDDETLDRALRTKNSEVIKTVTTMAFRPTLTTMIPAQVAKTMEEILGIQVEEEAKAAAAEPEAKATKPAAKKPAAKKAATAKA